MYLSAVYIPTLFINYVFIAKSNNKEKKRTTSVYREKKHPYICFVMTMY